MKLIGLIAALILVGCSQGPCHDGKRSVQRIAGTFEIEPTYGGTIEFEWLGDWERVDCHEERWARQRKEGETDWESDQKWHRKPKGKTPCTYCSCADCNCGDHCYRHCRDGDLDGFRPITIDKDGKRLPDDYGPDTCWCID